MAYQAESMAHTLPAVSPWSWTLQPPARYRGSVQYRRCTCGSKGKGGVGRAHQEQGAGSSGRYMSRQLEDRECHVQRGGCSAVGTCGLENVTHGTEYGSVGTCCAAAIHAGQPH